MMELSVSIYWILKLFYCKHSKGFSIEFTNTSSLCSKPQFSLFIFVNSHNGITGKTIFNRIIGYRFPVVPPQAGLISSYPQLTVAIIAHGHNAGEVVLCAKGSC